MLGGVRTLLLQQETFLFPAATTATASVVTPTLTLGASPIVLSGSYTTIITESGSYTTIITESGRSG